MDNADTERVCVGGVIDRDFAVTVDP